MKLLIVCSYMTLAMAVDITIVIILIVDAVDTVDDTDTVDDIDTMNILIVIFTTSVFQESSQSLPNPSSELLTKSKKAKVNYNF